MSAPKSVRPSASAPTPNGFPKVGAGEQKSRDGDRRAILSQELSIEQKSLEDAKRALAQQESSLGAAGNADPARTDERLKPYRDTIGLHERNIEALKKEIANLK